jgi:hypothetical protein
LKPIDVGDQTPPRGWQPPLEPIDCPVDFEDHPRPEF